MGIIWLLVFGGIILAVMECGLAYVTKQNLKRYVALEEWAEDWLKRLEQKCEANEDRIANLAAKAVEMEKLLPKGGNGEVIRNQALLQQMNDEMERTLEMEKEWNDSVNAILNYGKPIRGDKE